MNELHLGLQNFPLPELDKAYLRRAIDASTKSIDLKSDYLADQIVPTTASERFLKIHAALRKISRLEASEALGRVLAPPSVVELDARLLSAYGLEYKVTAKAQGFLSIQSIDKGSKANLSPGEKLTLLKPIPFVAQLEVDAEGIRGGTDQESLESFRRKILDDWSEPNEAGYVADYYRWLSRLTKGFVFAAYPAPGFVSWSGIVPVAGGDRDLPNDSIKAEVASYLEEKRPPLARVVYLGEAKIIRLDITLRVSPIGQDVFESVRAYVQQKIFERFCLFGVSEREGQGEITEGFVRNLFSQLLGNLEFDLTLAPANKIGVGKLALGEGILLGRLSLG